MKPSRKFLSLPIVSLSEGQHIGYVKSLVVDAQTKSLAALVIDPKGFFKDQRIIPYSKVVSVGDDAITIDKGMHVEKSTNLPEILTLMKEKLSIIGTRVITESGKTLGVAEEYYVDPETGQIMQIEITGGKIQGLLNGKAILGAEYVTTIGQDIIVAAKGSETHLVAADKGLSDSFKSLFHTTSHLASETTQSLSKLFKKEKSSEMAEETTLEASTAQDRPKDSVEGADSTSVTPPEPTEIALQVPDNPSQETSHASGQDTTTKEPLG